VAISGKMKATKQPSTLRHEYYTTPAMQRWNVLQHDLIPEIKQLCGALTPELEKLIHVLDWVRIEEC